MRVSIEIYPEVDGGECQFIAKAEVTFGTPARCYGPPEFCDPGDPTEVEWLSFEGEGERFDSADAFEAWLSARGASLDRLKQWEEEAIDRASDDQDCDDDFWREVG